MTIQDIITIAETDHLTAAERNKMLIDRYDQLDKIIRNCEAYAAKLCCNGIGVQQNWNLICEARKEAACFRAERERVFWEYLSCK